MRMMIVHDYVSNAINAALDKAMEDTPDAEVDREYLYDQLLAYYDEHGVIPEFSLTRTTGDDEDKDDA